MLPKFLPKRLGTPAGEILLREVQRKDLRALNGVINEPEVNRFVLVKKPVSLKSTFDVYANFKKSKTPWIACIFQGNAVGSINILERSGRESHVSGFGIAFSKKVHGTGVSEASIRYCFSWLRKNGIEKIVCEVISDNLRARAFYKKIGFRELCRLKNNFRRGENYFDTIVIEKFL